MGNHRYRKVSYRHAHCICECRAGHLRHRLRHRRPWAWHLDRHCDFKEPEILRLSWKTGKRAICHSMECECQRMPQLKKHKSPPSLVEGDTMARKSIALPGFESAREYRR